MKIQTFFSKNWQKLDYKTAPKFQKSNIRQASIEEFMVFKILYVLKMHKNKYLSCVYLYKELAIHALSPAVSQSEIDSFEFNSIIVLNMSGVQLFEQLYVSLVSSDDKH